MTPEQSMALMHLHVAAVNSILDGVELTVDGRACAAVYLARAGKILAALRVRGVTSQDEIDQLIEHLTLAAMKDEPGVARDGDGNEILSKAEKARRH